MKNKNLLNSKFEYLNSKQIRNSKFQCPKLIIFGHLNFGNLDLFRISDFGFRICSLILIFAFCSFILSGCATITDGAKGFLGVSTKILEDKRPEAITKTFNYDYSACYKKVEEEIKHMGAYVYVEDAKKKLVAVYVSAADTTPVGIFFKEIDAANTQIEISSPSKYAKELIAKRIFNFLEGKEEEIANVSK